jgi:SAM-dependent methyltransferase
MNVEEIQQAIAGFPRWHYQFNLNGQLTPIWRLDQVNRHEQRAGYFLDPLVGFLGGSLAEMRVLDLACNAGFWALRAVEAGCRHVLGVDARQMHIDQANFVFDVKNVPPDRYEFRCADIFDLDYRQLGPFDIVLCLGILYHISKPVELFEKIASAGARIVVVDTALSLAPGAYLEIRYESPEIPANAFGQPMVMYPTARAVIEILRQFGYTARMLRPEFTDYEGCWDYENGKRRAFVAIKRPEQLGAPLQFEEIPTRLAARRQQAGR